jgi:predicted dehydrogenase
MSAAPLRVAEVGLGWVATHRHLPTMMSDAGFSVLGVVDRHPGTAERVAASLHLRRWHRGDQLRDVPWIDEVDAVVVATTPFTHHRVIADALELGKHVLTEKPFAMSIHEGEELVELAKQRGLILAIVHNFQFSRSAKRLVDDIGSGALGTIRAVTATQYGNPNRRLPVWYEQLPFGLFYDESPHLLYLLRMLSPAPLKQLACNVFPSTTGVVTPAVINVTYAGSNGTDRIPFTLALHFESPVSEWHLSVLGDRGLGDADIFRDIYIRLPNDGAHETLSVVRTSWAATWAHWTQHVSRGPLHMAGRLRYGNQEVFSRFRTAVATGKEPEGISACDALAVLRMQHDIVDHARLL